MLDPDGLVGLWRGDDLSAAYRHPRLAFELCRHVQPVGPAQLAQMLEGCPASDVDEETLADVRRGLRRVGRVRPAQGEPVNAPDFVEPIVGWRVWALVPDREWEPALASVVHSCIWQPGRPVEATCGTDLSASWTGEGKVWSASRTWSTVDPPHDAPGDGCRCGVYATRHPGPALAYVPLPARAGSFLPVTHLPFAAGRVKLWGTVVEHEQGWRGAVAYPERVYIVNGTRLLDMPSLTWRSSTVDIARSIETRYGVPVHVVSRYDVADAERWPT